MSKLLKNGEYEYSQKDFVGKGAFAKVYKGIITKTQKVIAVRILSLGLVKQYGPKIKSIINGQVNVLKQISYSNHPDKMFTTKIYDCFLTQNNITMILQFCPDGNLQEIITKRGALQQNQAVEILYQIARGIEFISNNNVVHRDIKPDNIFIKKQQNGSILYKLGDFGFAVKKQLNDEIVGTPIFMSPELFRQEAYGSEVDVWAFGLMAHYILFKEFYFIAPSEKAIKKRVLTENYELRQAHRNKISTQMQDFLSQCLKKDKHDRIKANKLSQHPVFNKIRPKVQLLMQSVLKTSDINYSSTRSNTPKGLLMNYLTSFNFIFDFASKLTLMNPYNLASLYLHKNNFALLNQIKQRLQYKQNILDLNEWNDFIKSQDYKQVMSYLQKLYLMNKKSFEDLYNSLMNIISQRYSPQVAKGIQTNLGNGPFDKVKPQIISYELVNNIIPELRKNNSPENYCLVLEVMLIKSMIEGKRINLDFLALEMNKKTISLKQKSEMLEHELKNLK